MSKEESVAAMPWALSSLMRACSSSMYSTVSPGPQGLLSPPTPPSRDMLSYPWGVGSGPGSNLKCRFGASSMR